MTTASTTPRVEAGPPDGWQYTSGDCRNPACSTHLGQATFRRLKDSTDPRACVACGEPERGALFDGDEEPPRSRVVPRPAVEQGRADRDEYTVKRLEALTAATDAAVQASLASVQKSLAKARITLGPSVIDVAEMYGEPPVRARAEEHAPPTTAPDPREPMTDAEIDALLDAKIRDGLSLEKQLRLLATVADVPRLRAENAVLRANLQRWEERVNLSDRRLRRAVEVLDGRYDHEL